MIFKAKFEFPEDEIFEDWQNNFGKTKQFWKSDPTLICVMI